MVLSPLFLSFAVVCQCVLKHLGDVTTVLLDLFCLSLFCFFMSFQTDWWWSDQISVWSTGCCQTKYHWIITIIAIITIFITGENSSVLIILATTVGEPHGTKSKWLINVWYDKSADVALTTAQTSLSSVSSHIRSTLENYGCCYDSCAISCFPTGFSKRHEGYIPPRAGHLWFLSPRIPRQRDSFLFLIPVIPSSPSLSLIHEPAGCTICASPLWASPHSLAQGPNWSCGSAHQQRGQGSHYQGE